MLLRDHSRPAPSKTESSVQQTVYLEGASIPIGAANIISVVAQANNICELPIYRIAHNFLIVRNEHNLLHATEETKDH